jgi:hypothetical protein
VKWSEPREEIGRKASVATALFDRELALILRIACANVYNAPIHNPRIMKVYSVSFPVWGA